MILRPFTFSALADLHRERIQRCSAQAEADKQLGKEKMLANLRICVNGATEYLLKNGTVTVTTIGGGVKTVKTQKLAPDGTLKTDDVTITTARPFKPSASFKQKMGKAFDWENLSKTGP